MEQKKRVDKKDFLILKTLDKDARISIATIAQQLNVTENTIRYRIERLRTNGFLKGYSLKLSPSHFGKTIQVLLSVNVKPESLSSSLKRLSSYNEFTKVYRSSGKYSIVCIGFFNDNEHLEEFLNKKMLIEIPVTEWAEHIILKRYKNDEFNIGMI